MRQTLVSERNGSRCRSVSDCFVEAAPRAPRLNGESETSGLVSGRLTRRQGRGRASRAADTARDWDELETRVRHAVPLFSEFQNKVAARLRHPAPVGACIKDKAAKS